MVFSWHFLHAVKGYPVSFGVTPSIFPLALFDEGHVGVALFMCLSGYLFAKLLDGKTIKFSGFLTNRALRLLPLLFVALGVACAQNLAAGGSLLGFAKLIVKGAVFPVLPNGGWSITTEAHFYLAIPLLLWMFTKSKWLPLAVIAAALAFRLFIYSRSGEVQSLAYWTIIGRIDQFVLGMVAYQFRSALAHRHAVAAVVAACFAAFYWWFDRAGGFYGLGGYPSPSAMWIVLPTIEGAACAALIAWYDGSFSPSRSGASWIIGKLGEYSYSIYLLHFAVVFKLAMFINERVMDISNFYVAMAWSAVAFVAFLPVGYLSFRFIEAPFLRFRKPYLRSSAAEEAVVVPHISMDAYAK